jgi:Retrotransposon gag protein
MATAGPSKKRKSKAQQPGSDIILKVRAGTSAAQIAQIVDEANLTNYKVVACLRGFSSEGKPIQKSSSLPNISNSDLELENTQTHTSTPKKDEIPCITISDETLTKLDSILGNQETDLSLLFDDNSIQQINFLTSPNKSYRSRTPDNFVTATFEEFLTSGAMADKSAAGQQGLLTDGDGLPTLPSATLPAPMAQNLTIPVITTAATMHTATITTQSQAPILTGAITATTANIQHGGGAINQVNTKSKFRMEPPRFHGSSEQDITQWLTYYERACRVNSWETDLEKARYLPCFLESAASLWFDNLENVATPQNLSSFDYLKAEIIKAFDGQKNADAIEFTLRSRKMNPDESVSTYYHSMLNLCRRSNANMTDEAIVRHLMFGLTPNLMKHIMLMENNTPEQFYKNATKVERTIKLTGNNPTELTDITAKLTDLAKSVAAINTPKVNVIHSQPQQNPFYNTFPPRNNDANRFSQYNQADKGNNFGYRPKRNIVCFHCNIPGHIRPECRALRRQREQESRPTQWRNTQTANNNAFQGQQRQNTRFDSRNDRFDNRNDRFDNRNDRFDSRNGRSDNRNGRFDSRNGQQFQTNSLDRRPQNQVTFNTQNDRQNQDRQNFQRQNSEPIRQRVQQISEQAPVHSDEDDAESKND